MILRTLPFFIIWCFFVSATFEKSKYPQNDFISPLPQGTPLILAGTFGELRSNHFHGGLDLKTNGTTGMQLRAIADGYVSRIKVSSYGYGKVLYITHPNGYTSVYAHLEKYNDKIENFIKKIQKEKESWEIELYLGKTEIEVKQGEWVAVSGNSGASTAPHLHFEIRETKSQMPVDPLLCGIHIIDDINPRIYKFQVHPIGDKSMARVLYTNGRSSTKVSSAIQVRVSGSNSQYHLYPVREVQANGKVAFSISANDFHNGSFNKLGVPIIEVKVNGKTYFKQDIEGVPFSKNRYINALIDYETKVRTGVYFYRNYLLPGNKLSIYKKAVNDGIIQVQTDSLYHIAYTLLDRNNNKTTLEFDLRGVDYSYSETTIGAASAMHIKYDEAAVFETDDIKIEFPAYCFYEDFDFQYEEAAGYSGKYSGSHLIHNGYTPIHKFFTVSIKAPSLPKRYYNKAVVSRWGRSEGGYYKNGYVVARSKYFGKFYVDVDTVAPAIGLYNVYEGKNMSRYRSLMVKIGDNLSGIESYKTYLDGEFIIMSYDYKSGLISYDFEDSPSNSEHILEIVVNDRIGNISTKKVKFIR
ncbi:peptidoglycan DD-metalloendopeptidase family protein [bacterium]|nr:peptidoglycan DD-metalloendopeptidase family protein [bacterium]